MSCAAQVYLAIGELRCQILPRHHHSFQPERIHVHHSCSRPVARCLHNCLQGRLDLKSKYLCSPAVLFGMLGLKDLNTAQYCYGLKVTLVRTRFASWNKAETSRLANRRIPVSTSGASSSMNLSAATPHSTTASPDSPTRRRRAHVASQRCAFRFDHHGISARVPQFSHYHNCARIREY